MRSTLDALIRFTQQITAHADLAELRSRGFHDYESLEGTDLARFNSYMHGLFRTVEDAYYQQMHMTDANQALRLTPRRFPMHIYQVRPRKVRRAIHFAISAVSLRRSSIR
jgi:hypothetical protein